VAERREDLRAADADRQFVAERLRDALNEGRLSLGEYDDRLKEAYAARTYGDLDRLLGDLPTVASQQHSQVAPASPAGPVAAPQPAPAPMGAPPPPPGTGRPMARWLVTVWSAWAAAVFINIVIWLLVSLSTGELAYFWPMWVAGPWGAVLLALSVSGLAKGEHRSPEAYQRYQMRKMRRQAKYERRMRRYQER
jgi:hypothetical protein